MLRTVCLVLLILLGQALYAADAAVLTPAPATSAAAKPDAELFSEQEWNRLGASASAAANRPSGSAGTSGGTAGGLLLLGGSVLAIAAVIIVLGWATKKYALKRVMSGKGRHLEVLETVAIGFKRSVTLVRVGDQVLVIGAGEHELTRLGEVPLAGLVPTAPPAAETSTVPASAQDKVSAFQAKLAQLVSGRAS